MGKTNFDKFNENEFDYIGLEDQFLDDPDLLGEKEDEDEDDLKEARKRKREQEDEDELEEQDREDDLEESDKEDELEEQDDDFLGIIEAYKKKKRREQEDEDELEEQDKEDDLEESDDKDDLKEARKRKREQEDDELEESDKEDELDEESPEDEDHLEEAFKSLGLNRIDSNDVSTSQFTNLLEGIDTSAEFKQRVSTLFEAAVIDAANRKLHETTEKIKKAARQAYTKRIDFMAEALDKYLNHVANNWLRENKIAIDNSFQSAINENLVTELQRVFAENFVKVPESQVDLVERLTHKLNRLEGKLSESLDQRVALEEKVDLVKKALIVEAETEGMTDTQKSKVHKMVEGFAGDRDFAQKVKVICENLKAPSSKPRRDPRRIVEEFRGGPEHDSDSHEKENALGNLLESLDRLAPPER